MPHCRRQPLNPSFQNWSPLSHTRCRGLASTERIAAIETDYVTHAMGWARTYDTYWYDFAAAQVGEKTAQFDVEVAHTPDVTQIETDSATDVTVGRHD